MSQRFTIDGSDALERHLAQVCEQVCDGVCALVPGRALEGLLLGGGYGRGEGGVWATADGDRPYNDLEFYVFIRGNALLAERKFRHPLHELGERLSPGAGLEVEFKVLTLDKLRRSGPLMFYYDLVMGHRWFVGDDSLLAGCEHHRDAVGIPPHEATRLLMNRCSGLLFSAERLQRANFTADDADFVGRNLAKAQLAFGDVLLAACGQYDWSCCQRHERLQRLATNSDGNQSEEAQTSGAKNGDLLAQAATKLLSHHAAGVEFKLHPVRSMESRKTLAARHAELTALGRDLWLWVEARRLQTSFVDPRSYAFDPADKCPETSALRNCLVNTKTFGPSVLFAPWAVRYPRERLLRALALLLWEQEPSHDPAVLQRLQQELRADARDFAGLLAAYERLWHQFN